MFQKVLKVSCSAVRREAHPSLRQVKEKTDGWSLNFKQRVNKQLQVAFVCVRVRFPIAPSYIYSLARRVQRLAG